MEDSAFGFIVMEKTAPSSLCASWALNTLEVEEAPAPCRAPRRGQISTTACASTASGTISSTLSMRTGKTGCADFFKDSQVKPEMLELQTFLSAVRGEGELCVLPEQAWW